MLGWVVLVGNRERVAKLQEETLLIVVLLVAKLSKCLSFFFLNRIMLAIKQCCAIFCASFVIALN